MTEAEFLKKKRDGIRATFKDYFVKTVKSIFTRRDWWKISEDNGSIYECCDICFYLCPECGECHGKEALSLKDDTNDEMDLDFLDPLMFEHVGIGCPHKGQAGPKKEGEQ